MKKARFTETRIVPILRQQEAGKSFRDISREHGISDATFYNFDFKWPEKRGLQEHLFFCIIIN